MIHQQEWHTNHQGEGHTTVRNKIRVICGFPPGYYSRELTLAIAAYPEITMDYRELIATVEKTNSIRE